MRVIVILELLLLSAVTTVMAQTTPDVLRLDARCEHGGVRCSIYFCIDREYSVWRPLNPLVATQTGSFMSTTPVGSKRTVRWSFQASISSLGPASLIDGFPGNTVPIGIKVLDLSGRTGLPTDLQTVISALNTQDDVVYISPYVVTASYLGHTFRSALAIEAVGPSVIIGDATYPFLELGKSTSTISKPDFSDAAVRVDRPTAIKWLSEVVTRMTRSGSEVQDGGQK